MERGIDLVAAFPEILLAELLAPPVGVLLPLFEGELLVGFEGDSPAEELDLELEV